MVASCLEWDFHSRIAEGDGAVVVLACTFHCPNRVAPGWDVDEDEVFGVGFGGDDSGVLATHVHIGGFVVAGLSPIGFAEEDVGIAGAVDEFSGVGAVAGVGDDSAIGGGYPHGIGLDGVDCGIGDDGKVSNRVGVANAPGVEVEGIGHVVDLIWNVSAESP